MSSTDYTFFIDKIDIYTQYFHRQFSNQVIISTLSYAHSCWRPLWWPQSYWTWTVRHHDLTSELLVDVRCELEHLPNRWCHLWNRRLRLCEKILHRYDVTGWLHCEVLRLNIMHTALLMQTWYQSFAIPNARLDVFCVRYRYFQCKNHNCCIFLYSQASCYATDEFQIFSMHRPSSVSVLWMLLRGICLFSC